MRGRVEALTLVGDLHSQMTSALANLAEVRKSTLAKLGEDEATANLAVVELRNAIEAIIGGVTVYDKRGNLTLSAKNFITTMSTNAVNGKVCYLDFAIKSRLYAGFKYKAVTSINNDENFLKNLCDAYINGVVQIAYHTLAFENLTELNVKLSDIFTENNVALTFSFTISDKFVVSISDKEVVFGASVTELLNCNLLPVMQSGGEFDEVLRVSGEAKIVNALNACPTTASIVKCNLPIILTLTETSKTKRRAHKLIRKAYKTKAKHLKKHKSGGYGYVNETVKIGDEDVEIFGIVRKADDGVTVVLSPFDTVTLLNVDFDLLSYYEEC